MMIPTIAFTAALVGMVLSLFKVHRLYRGAGFSIDKARKEFSEGVMSDRNVQQVCHTRYDRFNTSIITATFKAANTAARAAAAHAVNQTVSGRY
jgi:hypothetical protein